MSRATTVRSSIASCIGPALLRVRAASSTRASQWRNPVMFVVYIGTIVTAAPVCAGARAATARRLPGSFSPITIWLLFTVLFANFAEALAEGRSRAQAAALRSMRQTVLAKKLHRPDRAPARDDARQGGGSAQGRRGAGRGAATSSPPTAKSIEGAASVDESAITGESAPVIRESGGDFSSVTGGTRVLSDWIVVRVVGQSRRDLPRPDDLDGRGREAAEDPQRDRAHHPAGGADARLSGRHRHACCRSRCSASRSARRAAGHDHGPGGAAGVPDSRPRSAACCRRSAWPA